ncbi:uncharacterized protein LOC116918456 [Daphnia magna]|uniref:uncharacterized protein LOC116918456 n=1 Tax=Daphnia magna TaxID=35525 RepID=UPI001E1BCA57|nr:uncharacterized protein LOC116918456 [Daphnia magna]
MSYRPGGSQSRNRRLIPQKLSHFFSSFPDSYEFPAVPDWLLRRPMGSVWCVPKSPQQQHRHGSARNTGRRNRIEPESNAQFLPRNRSSSRKRTDKVADLTYKNTWSSFLKTSKSDQVTFFPIKAPPTMVEPVNGRPSVRFNQRRSWDDTAVLDHQLSTENRYRKPLSSSPVRRRPSSMRNDSRKYSKLESKALREAWLNENVFPQFAGSIYSASSAALMASSAEEPPTVRHCKNSAYTLREYLRPCPAIPPYRPGRRKVDSVEANVSSGTTDSVFTPGSMEMSGTSTLATTSGSVNVNATSSPTTSFDSMQARYSTRPTVHSPPIRHQSSRFQDDSLETAETSQSVEVQVSSTLTTRSSSTSMQPHMSSDSSMGYPPLFVNKNAASTMARDVLIRERAISSANSRKSCLKEANTRKSRLTTFKDPSRLEWTKRYLYTLAPTTNRNSYHHDRSSSMSRVSSSDPRDFQIYTVQQRPWQSNPDLRMQKWKPNALTKTNLGFHSSSAEDSLDALDLLNQKKQFLKQLFGEKKDDEGSYRSLKREARSLALLQSATLPRCLSAGRSRSSENSGQYSTGYGSDDLAKWKANSCNSGRSIKKIIPDYKKSHEMLARELDFRKKQNLTTTARPFIFSTDNLLSTEKFSLGSEAANCDEKRSSFSTRQTPRNKLVPSSARLRSPDKQQRSCVKFDALQSFNSPLQPASGENKASVLRRRLTKKKCEEQLANSWQQQERERERRSRLRAIRLDPAWTNVRGGDQALEDIAHRRCYKEVVERERLLQYYMDKEEMLTRVWQMPPLFERQAMDKKEIHPSGLQVYPDRTSATTLNMSFNPTNSRSSGGVRKKTAFRNSPKTEESLDCYMASESLQLSRPSTAKSSNDRFKARQRL